MTSDALVPLYGFVRGDMLGLLVLVRADDSVATLIETLEQASAVRVAASGRARLFASGRELDRASTVAAAGLAPLERVDLVPEGG
jgi:Toluene-4-monooxygenase system protein B (TmoB)